MSRAIRYHALLAGAVILAGWSHPCRAASPSARVTFDHDDDAGQLRALIDGADGLIPGHYRVGIDCWETLPQAGGPPAKSLVPARYREPATSGLELVVELGARPMTVEFDVRLDSP